MSAIDKFINELRRTGDTTLILLSESEPRLRGKGGEHALEGKISHKHVTALVEEIVPPECFADLVMMDPVEFPLIHDAGELSIRVVPGPSIWRVVMEVRGEGLAPLPAGDSEEERSPSRTFQGLGSGPVEADASAPSEEPAKEPRESGEINVARAPASSNPLDEALDEAALAASGDDDDVPLSEALLGDDDDDIDLTSFIPEDGPDAPATAVDLSAPGDPVPEYPDQRSTKRLQEGVRGSDPVMESAMEAARGPASEPEPAPDPDPDQRSTKRLKEGVQGSDPAMEIDLDPSGNREPSVGAPSDLEPAPGPALPVVPLEIDFGDGEMPHAIEGLDTLLDAAWSQGATGVLLRDDRAPLMLRGGKVSALPFATPQQSRVVHDLVDIVASPSEAEQLEIRGQCRFVYLTGSSTRVRCTLVQDGGALAASVKRIGDEHLAEHAELWMPDALRKLLPPYGLVLVCGPPGQGKTTTAMALATEAHERSQQTVVVGEPLERRLAAEGAGVLQRRIPDDVPNCAQALGDLHLLDSSLVLVDVPRPEREVLAMLSLAGQGRLVIATWTAPDCVEAIQGLMDALPPELAPAERARRVRNLVGVIAVKLVPAAQAGVLPLFEILRTNPALLGAVAESRLDALRGTEIRQLTFESSRALLADRGLL